MAHLLEQGNWILEEFLKGLPQAPAGAAWQLFETPPALPESALRWRQPFSTLPQDLWVILSGAKSVDMIEPAFAQLSRSMTARSGREVTPLNGQETAENPPTLRWAGLELGDVTLYLGIPAEVEDLFEAEPTTKTFDLLLDVELPVKVSFGRAQVALKEVLKLTTGSIVELNRAIVEPVDVVVNNCVIARGEVVVVEGNFGVRIQHVVSRGERLRSMQ